MILISSFLKRLKLLNYNYNQNNYNKALISLVLVFILFITQSPDKANSQQFSQIEDDLLLFPNQDNIDPNSIKSHDSNLNDEQDTNDDSIDTSDRQDRHESDCYDSVSGAAKKCMPEFVNAAFGLKIIASNTCGLKHQTEYCVQSNLHNLFYSKGSHADSNTNLNDNNDFLSRFNSRCQKCDSNDKRYAHPPEYLNDYNNQGNITWWQSETMLEGVQYPNVVNLTLHLGKSFDINYIQVKFHSPRPESFAIYKRANDTAEWTPYQFYSASCRETYGVQTDQIVRAGNEAIALCTDEFSDIAPLTGASVVFGTLEDRPSAYNFENTPELIDWVTATDVRISLNRLNTFGDEVFNDPQVLKSYYYAISDIAVGGRCKCNGHASKCVYEQQHDFEDRLKCQCEHNTAGVDCSECLPFFNDVPWAQATQLNAHECRPCSCNGLSLKCHFNQTLYDLTGHGGYCDNCEGNTAGAHCDECKFGFYRRENENRCVDCQCNHFGSESLQCDPSGKCRCRPGVVGEKCDRCAPYHYELSIVGCKLCNCNPIGSFDSPPICDPRDGSCRCKANVEGQNCDRPKPGFFNLAPENLYGAIPCFCYAHSSTCHSSTDYFVTNITSKFTDASKHHAVNSRGQRVDLQMQNAELNVNVVSSHDDIWFLAPAVFTGNQQKSYNQDLTFELRIENLQEQAVLQSARPSRKDIVLESSHYNLEVYSPIYGGSNGASSSQRSSNQLPTQDKQTFTFKLNHYSGWMPQLNNLDFQRLLSNLSSIKIRASYIQNTRAILSKISLTSSKPFSQKSELDEIYLDENGQLHKQELKTALFVEECKCPTGHIGQQCELCAEGFRREPVNGGPFAKCVPCNCNHHSLSCEPNTGKCECLHHTSGDNCEKCEEGYYGNSILGHRQEDGLMSEYELSNMCKKCPCPNDGPCAEIYNYQLQTSEIVCLSCPQGTQGNLCELCDDGYFSPEDGLDTCEKCDCNENIDENAIGNCNSQNGNCQKCVFNTTGERCEKCLPKHWGNALTTLKCHSCDCFDKGTFEDENNEPKQCNLNDGQCECKPNVKNRQCDECKEGYWNLMSNNGCEECKCNPLGSYNFSCDSLTGQCFCRPGVQGLKCDSCMPLWYGFSDEGCKQCNCDEFGTEPGSLQCDDFGKCKCRENFAGLKCSQCEENRYNYTSGCLKCDDCFNLVQEQVNLLRDKIGLIEINLNEMLANENGQGSSDSSDQNIQLQNKLNSLKSLIDSLHADLYENRNLKSTYKESIDYLNSELKRITERVKSTDQLFDQFNTMFKQAERLYNQANNSVYQAQTQLSFINKINDDQESHIETIKQTRLDEEQNIKLQNLAKQSRETADLQKQIAHNASESLKLNLKASQNTLKDLQDILFKYEQLENERKEEYLTFNYDTLKLTAANLITEATEQKDILDQNVKEANDFIKRLQGFKVPDEKEIDEFNQETRNLANEISQKSNLLKKEIDELRSKFEKFADVDFVNTMGAAQTQLNNAKIKQKDIDYLFSLAELNRNESDSAISLASQVFENATKILETLQKFDELISNGKEKMTKAELLKPIIQDNIENSNDLVEKIEGNLRSLDSQIKSVKQKSLNTKLILDGADSTLSKLEVNVKDLKNLTSQLEEKMSQMVNEYQQTTEVKASEAIALHSNLVSRSDAVLKQAEQVTNGTQKLLDDSNNALDSLNKINKSISDFSVSDIKREELTRLQQKFEQISLELDQEGQLDESIMNLEKTTTYLLNTAKQYEYQVDYLRKQVENLEEINNSLERNCYANIAAKPEL